MKPRSAMLAGLLMLLLLGCMNASTSTVMHTHSELLNSTAVAPRHGSVGPIADHYNAQTARISDPAYVKAPKRDPYHCAKSAYSKAQNKTVSIDFIEMDLREALLELSLTTNFPIIADDTVAGIVSLTLNKVSFAKALTILLASGDYSYRFFKDYVLIGSSTPDGPSFTKLSKTCRYKPKYATPQDLAASLSTYYQQFVRVPSKGDYLTITAPKTIQAQIRRSLELFDERPGQVMLEMSVIEVSRDALSILGLAWNTDKSKPVNTTNSSVGVRSSMGNAMTQVGLTFSALPQQSLVRSIRSLQSDGKATVKAMPSIVSIDGAEARFQSIQTVWITHSNESRNAYSNVEQLSYGVDMSVVPRISFDGQVSLQIIKASVSDLTEDHDAKPRLIAHSITNTVDVPDGDYLVLGGLLQKKVRRMHNKLPIGLSNTPLGFLTGQKKAVDEEMEVLIMIRPRILHS